VVPRAVSARAVATAASKLRRRSAIEDMTGRPAIEANEVTRARCAQLVGVRSGLSPQYWIFSHCYLAGSVALGFGEDFFHVANKAAREVAMMNYSSHVELCRSRLVLMVLFWCRHGGLASQNDREVLDD